MIAKNRSGIAAIAKGAEVVFALASELGDRGSAAALGRSNWGNRWLGAAEVAFAPFSTERLPQNFAV